MERHHRAPLVDEEEEFGAVHSLRNQHQIEEDPLPPDPIDGRRQVEHFRRPLGDHPTEVSPTLLHLAPGHREVFSGLEEPIQGRLLVSLPRATDGAGRDYLVIDRHC